MKAEYSTPGRLHVLLAHSRDVDAGAYPALVSQELAFPLLRVGLHVIGASSLVRVEGAGVSLTELIACEGQGRVRGAIAAAVVTLAGRSAASLAASERRFSYGGRLWTASLGEGGVRSTLEHSLEHVFPGPGSPLTRIEAGSLEGGIRLRTRHDYPEAGVTVWSESDWRFRSL